MGRKTQITEEQLLEAGLRIIIRDGHQNISIKSVAAEAGCSTTPITWSFGNIDQYRNALRVYATEYMHNKMRGGGQNPIPISRDTGKVYIDMAIDEPNLIRYLKSDEEALKEAGGIGFIFDEEKVRIVCRQMAQAMGLPEEDMAAFLRFVSFHTEGIVSMILSGAYELDKETAHYMADEAGDAYIAYLKMKHMKGGA